MRFEALRVKGHGWVVFMDGKPLDGYPKKELAVGYCDYMNRHHPKAPSERTPD